MSNLSLSVVLEVDVFWHDWHLHWENESRTGRRQIAFQIGPVIVTLTTPAQAHA